jgi:hypothetical protein
MEHFAILEDYFWLIQYRGQYLSNKIQRNVARAIPIIAHNEFHVDFKPHAHFCWRWLENRILERKWCGRKVLRPATLCTKRQRCCLPLHMVVRLTTAVDSVQVWTYYSCYAIVESVWSEVVFVRFVVPGQSNKRLWIFAEKKNQNIYLFPYMIHVWKCTFEKWALLGYYAASNGIFDSELN